MPKNTIKDDIDDLIKARKELTKFRDYEYYNQMKDFYSGLIKEFRKENSNRINRKPGNRIFKAKHFKEQLIGLLKQIVNEECEITPEKNIPFKPEYKNIKKKKRIDIKIGCENDFQQRPIFFLELKYTLDTDNLGSALLESMLWNRNKQDKFYVVTLIEKPKNNIDPYSELCKLKPFSDYIDGVANLNILFDLKLENARKMLDSIKKIYG